MKTNWCEPLGPEMPIGTQEIHIWRVPLWSGAICPPSFSSQERIRAERFHSEQPRQRFITSHIAMRDILANYLQTSPAEIRIVQPDLKKPYLAGNASAGAISFNLSRSEDMCLIAVTASVQAGVDIECLRPERYEPGMESLVFTASESAALAAIEPEERWRAFLRGWTRKEAYGKCLGLGLSADLAHAELGLTEETIRFQGIAVASFVPCDRFIAAWAAADALTPSFWNWTP